MGTMGLLDDCLFLNRLVTAEMTEDAESLNALLDGTDDPVGVDVEDEAG